MGHRIAFIEIVYAQGSVTGMSSETVRKRTRWYQFTLKELFVTLTIVSLFLGWIGYHINWIRERKQCVNRLRAKMEKLDIEMHFFGRDHDKPMPFGLRVLGVPQTAQVWVWFDEDADEPGPTREAALQEIAEVERLFPDGEVMARVKTS
ncbi:MAG TPA: hypothetical protein VGJ26_03680, partial [Pirellulales bacterium]